MMFEDLSLAIHDPGMGIGPVAFGGNPLIPVMIRMGALFPLNGIKPGILPRRLIKMAMNRYKGVFHLISCDRGFKMDMLFSIIGHKAS